jgi:hypothetical protein
MTPTVIPITPLYLRYRALRRADQAERLRYARDVLANPAWLAEEFITTVLRFGEYDNADQRFYGKRDAHTLADSVSEDVRQQQVGDDSSPLPRNAESDAQAERVLRQDLACRA